MMIVDLALGCISKTMPQLNVMTAGLSIRAIVGMLVLIVGLMVTCRVLDGAVQQSMESVGQHYTTLGAK
jgi:flagellar biosynthesis protein FliR